MNTMRKRILVFVGVLLLAGCGGGGNVPVINKSPDRVIPDAYQVKQGDSIYEISWAFGVDYLDIAEWNELQEPYRLNAGQVLYLQEPTVRTTPLVDSSAAPEPTVVASQLPDNPTPPASQPKLSSAPVVSFSTNPGKWNWPAEGRLAGKFDPSKGNNGIQIAGQAGSSVKATATGEVVYVGEGLRGYGKLIILKHSEEFLSAYAHNDQIQVDEGQVVSSGQQIATMGSSESDSPMLHFEIRKDGEPVDPMKYLN